MSRATAFRCTCALLGALWLVAGVALLGAFLGYHAPGGRSQGPFSSMGPQGHYMAAFAGCALVVWSFLLLAAARRPEQGRTVGTASALGLVLCAVQRMIAWVVGDHADLGAVLRVEAAVLLVFALGFVWLRPPALPPAATVERA
jgi:hypothetical protein